MPFEASGFSLDRCCPRNLHNLLAGIRLISWRLGDFIQQFQSDRFINGMSLALCLFYLLFTVFGDDMARRGFNNSQLFWAIALVPLLGPLAYLCWRPPLRETSGEVAQAPWPAARDRELYQHLPEKLKLDLCNSTCVLL